MESSKLTSQRVFRIAAWIWLFYSTTLIIIDAFIYPFQPIFSPIFYYHVMNAIPLLVFFAISYSGWLKRYAKSAALTMILLITATPIFTNYLFDLHLPPAPLSNIEGMVLRQLPVLLVGLVLVAWHYDMKTMVLYSMASNIVEFSFVYFLRLIPGERMTAFSFIILIRTISFVVVGVFINQLIVYLRQQQESLIQANAQLTHYASTLEQLTINRERNRISRELHDTVVHSLSGLSVQLETVKAYLDIDKKTALGLLEKSLEATRNGLAETRRSLLSMRASTLEDLGLKLAIQKISASSAEKAGIELDLTLPERDFVIPPDVEQCVYRIVQEGIENAVTHSSAKKISLTLSIHEKDLRLCIQDDGIGFDPDLVLLNGHFGIIGMKERAHLLGGDFTIKSKPNCGTTLELVIKGCVE